MIIIVAKTGHVISGADLVTATLRTDLVPVPVTLELTALSTPELDKALVVGAELLVGDIGILITIIKAMPVKTQVIKNGRRIGGVACTGVLTSCKKLMEPVNNAINLTDTTFGGAVRASGATIAIADDLPLPRFVCFKGQTPSHQIAKYLQQEAAVIVFRRGQLSILKVDALLADEPIGKYDSSAIAWIDSPNVQATKTPSFVSMGADGSSVEGENTTTGRPVSYLPGLDARQLKNLEKVLITRGTMIRPLDYKLQAGQLIQVGKMKLTILTSANHVNTTTNSVMATKVWLASL